MLNLQRKFMTLQRQGKGSLKNIDLEHVARLLRNKYRQDFFLIVKAHPTC